jgi:hypothetical protein
LTGTNQVDLGDNGSDLMLSNQLRTIRILSVLELLLFSADQSTELLYTFGVVFFGEFEVYGSWGDV